MDMLKRFWNDESGQGIAEYALIIAFISLGLVLAMTVFRDDLGLAFDRVRTELSNANVNQFSPS